MFPTEFRKNTFVGKALDIIYFTGNQIIFRFGPNLSICAEVEFRYKRDDTEAEFSVIEVPSLQSDLMNLIEHDVVKVDIIDGQTLSLHFDNSAILQFFDFWEGGPYESYIVVIEGSEFRI